MEIELFLSIVGVFGVAALGINGYFLRGIFQDLNEVKINLAVTISQGAEKDRKIEEHEKIIKDLVTRVHALEFEVRK